jgi:hypothetical protein
MSPRSESEAVRIDRRIVEMNDACKVLFPDDGIAKREPSNTTSG